MKLSSCLRPCTNHLQATQALKSLRTLGLLAGLLGLTAWGNFTSAAHAMSIREYRALENTETQGPLYTQYYLVGVMEGALEANRSSTNQGGPALFCLNGRKLEPTMAESLYSTELKRNAELYEADMPVQLVLLNALTHVYTC